MLGSLADNARIAIQIITNSHPSASDVPVLRQFGGIFEVIGDVA
jgi:hypothetical protein